MQAVSDIPKKQDRETIRCPHCGKMIFDGDVIKARIVKVLSSGVEAKCYCKSWVQLPLTYAPNQKTA